MDTQAIREIQESLRLLSFYDPRLPPLAVDGVYSQQTAQAVRIFQTLYDLNPTGEVDNATWEELRDSANDYQPSSPSEIQAFPDPYYIVQIRDENMTVHFIQLMLQELSGFYRNIQFVEANGVFDETTEKAIRHIQQLHHLEATGKVDLKTWNVLAAMFNNRFDTTRR